MHVYRHGQLDIVYISEPLTSLISIGLLIDIVNGFDMCTKFQLPKLYIQQRTSEKEVFPVQVQFE